MQAIRPAARPNTIKVVQPHSSGRSLRAGVDSVYWLYLIYARDGSEVKVGMTGD